MSCPRAVGCAPGNSGCAGTGLEGRAAGSQVGRDTVANAHEIEQAIVPLIEKVEVSPVGMRRQEEICVATDSALEPLQSSSNKLNNGVGRP